MQSLEATWDEGQAGGLPGGGCTVRDGRSQERCSGQENCMCQDLGWGKKELWAGISGSCSSFATNWLRNP